MSTHRHAVGALLALLTITALVGCGEAGVGAAGHGPGTQSDATGRAAAAAPAAGDPSDPKGIAREVADPEESRSYPAPGSVHHRAAATPKRAGEAIVAAGAPSDAEVRAELAQMHAAESAAVMRCLFSPCGRRTG